MTSTASGACWSTGTGRCRSSSPARHTRPTIPASRCPVGLPVYPRSILRGPRGLSRGLGHARGAPPGAGRGPLAQSAARPDGSLGHQRNEGGAEWRAAARHPRRLVAGGLRWNGRLGHSTHTRRPRDERRGCRGRGAALRAPRREDRAALLHPGERHSRRLGERDAACDPAGGKPLHRAPYGAGLYPGLLCPHPDRRTPNRRPADSMTTAAPTRPPSPLASASGRPVSVVHLTAEYLPFARTGGLGEAVRGLAEFQHAAGLDVSVVMPLYRTVRDEAPDLQPV